MKGIDLKKRSGQTSLILILLTAVAMIFFAITLNWGQLAQIKALTSTSATSSASNLASNFASYGEREIKTTLGGTWKKCKHTSVLVAIITVIIIIIIIIVTWGTGTAGAMAFGAAVLGGNAAAVALAIALVLSIAAVAMQVAIVQPGLTRLWNKLQANLPVTDQFLEQGISGALQGVTTDRVVITDFFDMDTDGKFGLKATGLPVDEVGRFGFYYTERLKTLKPTTLDLAGFRSGLTAFNGALVAPCTDQRDPHCNSCCVPLENPEVPGIRVRPSVNTVGTACNPGTGPDYVDPQCIIGVVWPYGAPDPFADPAGPRQSSQYYPLVYDHTYGSGLLANFGLDSEAQVLQYSPPPLPALPGYTGFVKADAKGVFSFLWEMEPLRTDLNVQPSESTLPPLPFPPAKDGRYSDMVTEMPNYKGAGDCKGDNPANGFQWRKGADQYCSTTWPYSCTPICSDTDCGCTTNEDLLDDLVYGLKQFNMWGKSFLASDPAQLSQRIEEWYPEAASWVGPACTGLNDLVCYSGGGPDAGDGGVLYTYKKRLEKWETFVNGWLNKSYADGTAWCVPPSSAGMAAPEIAAITAAGPWGQLDSVLACYDYNKDNAAKFGQCQTDLAAIAAGQCSVATCAGTFNPCDTVALAGAIAAKNSQAAIELAKIVIPPPALTAAQIAANAVFLANATAATTCANQLAMVSCPGMPLSCVNNPRSLNAKPQPLYDPCATPSKYAEWVTESTQLAVPQGPKFVARKTYLAALKKKAEDARDAIRALKDSLTDFLNGPVTGLINARNQFNTMAKNKLPNYIIYAWRDKNPPKSGIRAKGYWHIVKAEGDAPGKCAWGKCITNRLPWVRTYTKGFLKSTRCYELTDYEGKVRIKVARWDEEHDGNGVAFANKFPIWKFSFRKPGSNIDSASGLENTCVGTPVWYHFGVNDPTIVALGAMWGSEVPPKLTETRLKEAFMLNDSPNPNEAGCKTLVEKLLSQGSSSEVCAKYFLKEPGRNGMDLKFTSCD